jgi:hypothetical protein
MIIQRQYSLPNCTLLLEGFSRPAATVAQTGPGDPERLDILTRFECHLTGLKQPLIGGRELLEALATAASQCTQEWLSGIRRSPRAALRSTSDAVEYWPLEPNVFRWLVPSSLLTEALPGPKAQERKSAAGDPLELTLSTIQLFDLVEAFDQLLSDRQTLSDLSLELRSLPRKAAAARPVAERAAPATLGIGSLAVAAAALFFVPVPEVQRPRPTTPQESNPSGSEQPSSAAPPGPNAQPLAPGAALATASLISDPQQLQTLNRQLYDQVNQAWRTTPTFSEDLIYRVGVNPQGEIVGYQPQNQAAVDFSKEVPLLDLLKTPQTEAATSQALLAQYRVVFTPDGTLEVQGWGQ